MFSRRLILTSATLPLLTRTGFAQQAILKSLDGDHTQSLQAAIDAAQSAGGLVELAAGTFRVNNLKINGSITLRGIPGLTVLRSGQDGRVLSISDAGLVKLEGITFQAKGVLGDVVRADGVARLIVDGCSFAGGGNGLHLVGCGGRIVGNSFKFHQATGLLSENATGLEISGNTLSDIGNNGIQVWRSEIGEDGTIVSNNRVSRIAAENGGDGQNGNAVNVYKAGSVVVANNRLSDCAFTGIRNNAGSNCVISGNSISRCNEVALYVEFGFQGAVVSNNIIEQAAHGISITNYNDGGRLAVCTGNLLRNLKGLNAHGVELSAGISAEADTVINSNVIENADSYGIGLGWGKYGRNLAAANNTLLNCRRGIVFSMLADGPYVLSGNLISGHRTGAIVGMDHEKAITDDLSIAGAALPNSLALSGNIVRS